MFRSCSLTKSCSWSLTPAHLETDGVHLNAAALRETLGTLVNTHLWLINFVVLCRPSSSMNPCRDRKEVAAACDQMLNEWSRSGNLCVGLTLIRPSLSSLRQIIRDSSLPIFILNPMLDWGIPFEPQDNTGEKTQKAAC